MELVILAGQLFSFSILSSEFYCLCWKSPLSLNVIPWKFLLLSFSLYFWFLAVWLWYTSMWFSLFTSWLNSVNFLNLNYISSVSGNSCLLSLNNALFSLSISLVCVYYPFSLCAICPLHSFLYFPFFFLFVFSLDIFYCLTVH